MKRAFAMVIAVLLLLTVLPLPAQANSGPSRWQGTNSSGIVVTGENCPIVVEHENLVFDIFEFPLEYYHSKKSYEMYSGRVSAEYTFVNPTDQEVRVTFVFPFGTTPDYAFYDFDDPDAFHDWEKYGVTANGETISATVRHTLSYYGHSFSVEEDLALLHDGYMEDDFYRPDLPVTKYVWKVTGVDHETYRAAFAGAKLSADPSKTKLWMEQCNGGDTHEGYIQVGRFLDRNPDRNTVTLYVLGEVPEQMPEWKVYSNGSMRQEIGGEAEFISTETMTLFQMLMVDCDPESGVLEHDWYNALVTSMKRSEWDYGFIGPDWSIGNEDRMSGILMRWYEYELVFAPGQRIVNTVTAPLYPDIEMDYEPFRYSYTYLLSPAALWADFGTLDITVNTPFYMVEATNVSFEWDNPGYSAHLDGLPEGELEFILSQSQNPSSTVKTIQQIYQGLSGNAVFLMAILLAAFLFGFAVWKLFVRKHIHLD